MPDPTAPRILIVRLSAIGDVIHGLPVLCALRAAWPKAFLAWVVEGRAAELLADHPALDALVSLKRGWLKRPASILDARRRLQALDCETSLDLQGLSKSAIAARLSGARRRIGFAVPAGREISPWLNNLRVPATATHVIEQNLELLRPLSLPNQSPQGAAMPAVRFDLPDKPAAAAAAQAICQREQLTGPFALINPGAGWASKVWPAERFAGVARHLGDRHGLSSLVVWAGEKELAWARQIASESGGHARVAPATSLAELASLARQAALFVSADTGPLHIAAAVGTPTVGLFGPMPGERNGAYGSEHITIQKAWLSGSSRDRRTADDATMRAISVADVTTACDLQLHRAAQRRACA